MNNYEKVKAMPFEEAFGLFNKSELDIDLMTEVLGDFVTDCEKCDLRKTCDESRRDRCSLVIKDWLKEEADKLE